MNKISTSSYHPCTNGGIERVNHTMALVLVMVGNELQNDWDLTSSSHRKRLQRLRQRRDRAGPQRSTH